VAFCDIAAQITSVPYAMSTPDDLAETVEQVEALDRRCVGMVGDTRDGARMREVVEQTITELGGVDFCLANAGIFTFSTIAEMSEQDWAETIDTNLTGVFHTFRAVLPHMIERGFGRIVATSSMAGKMGFANIGHYVASSGASSDSSSRPPRRWPARASRSTPCVRRASARA
jgi:NADP-dependent 3-hydroxy acid dehydrogenase YdfG